MSDLILYLGYLMLLFILLYTFFEFIRVLNHFIDNWNNLKKYVKENLTADNLIQSMIFLDKMEELERSDSNVKNKRNNK